MLLLPEGNAFLDGAKSWLSEPAVRQSGLVIGSYGFC